MNRKGFLGPIGDDLPSLIPLLFGLIIFFAVFSNTWQTFDGKSDYFNAALDTVEVGKMLTANTYVSGIEDFEARCEKARGVERIRFIAGLIPLDTTIEGEEFQGTRLQNLQFFGQGENVFECSNTEEPIDLESRHLSKRFLPVALEFKDSGRNIFYVRPMLMVVVTW